MGILQLIEKDKKIVVNALLLFVRMFVLMLVNLLMVSMLLKQHRLGVEGFGIYNAVAGIALLMSSLTVVLSMATQRFFSYADGKHDSKLRGQVYSVSTNISLLLIGVSILLFETVGLWFLHTHMTIPEGRMWVADVIYQGAIVTFSMSLLQVTPMAAIIAHENMGYYTILSTVECLMRLLVVATIGCMPVDGLVWYGLGLPVVSVCTTLFYWTVVHRNYTECRLTVVEDRSLYGKLLSFSGWTMLGSIANVCLIQGITLAFNVYLGPKVNGNFAVALQVNNALVTLANVIVLALRPAMIRSYASEDYKQLNHLFWLCKLCLIVMGVCVALPLVLLMPWVLNVWLGSTTDGMVSLTRWMVLFAMIMTFHNPITTIIHAANKVKVYHLVVETLTMMALPIAILLLSTNHSAVAVCQSLCVVNILVYMVRWICLLRYYNPLKHEPVL